MDGLSAAASILAVVELAAKTASICLEYGHKVKNAKTDIQRLRSELTNLEGVLQGARDLYKDTYTSSFQPPNKALEDCIDACSKELSNLLRTLEPGKTKKLAAKIRLRELKWPFETKQINQTIQRIAEYRETITLALQISSG